MTEEFKAFTARLQSERVELYNYFHDHTWENKYTNIYIYSLPNANKKADLTRQARFGAHFVIKRYYAGQRAYESKRSVYITRHTEKVNNELCFVIRQDVLDSLAQDHQYEPYVLFENGDKFSEMIKVHDLRLSRNIFYKKKNQQGVTKYYYQARDFKLIEKNSSQPVEDIPYFQPQYIGNFRFHLTVHGHAADVKVFKGKNLIQTGNYNTLAEFFRAFKLDEKGAKLTSIQKMYKKHQNFTFKGLTFIFDDNWDMVDYRIRLSKEQKKLIKEIEAKRKELENTEPEIEEINVYSTREVTPDDEEEVEIQYIQDLGTSMICDNPPGMYWDEETGEFKESTSLWDLSA